MGVTIITCCGCDAKCWDNDETLFYCYTCGDMYCPFWCSDMIGNNEEECKYCTGEDLRESTSMRWFYWVSRSEKLDRICLIKEKKNKKKILIRSK